MQQHESERKAKPAVHRRSQTPTCGRGRGVLRLALRGWPHGLQWHQPARHRLPLAKARKRWVQHPLDPRGICVRPTRLRTVEGGCLRVEGTVSEQMGTRVVEKGRESVISALTVVMDGVRPGLRRGVIVSVLVLGVAACLTFATKEQTMMIS